MTFGCHVQCVNRTAHTEMLMRLFQQLTETCAEVDLLSFFLHKVERSDRFLRFYLVHCTHSAQLQPYVLFSAILLYMTSITQWILVGRLWMILMLSVMMVFTIDSLSQSQSQSQCQSQSQSQSHSQSHNQSQSQSQRCFPMAIVIFLFGLFFQYIWA